MSIGRKPYTRVGIPNNRYMPGRANVHLENYAISKAEHYETSLRVDSPRFYFWNKHQGSIPCSCTAANKSYNLDIEPGEPAKVSFTKETPLKVTSNDKYSIYEEADPQDRYYKQVADPDARGRKKTMEEYLFNEGNIGDQIEDINEVDEVTESITDFADPFNLFSDRTIMCPICMGSGFLDGYNLYGGNRVVLETSNIYKFYSENADIVETDNPTKVIVNPKGKLFWSLPLPKLWLHIAKIEIYNGQDAIPSDEYSFKWFSSTSEGPVTAKSLETLNNSGEVVRLVLEFPVKTSFTHAVIVFSYRDPHKAQIPEVAQGWEQEFLDWNVNVTMELPPTIDIKEGSYITESKYGKVWKVSALTPRFTEGGTVFGLSADVRALQPMEKKFYHFKLFDIPLTNYKYSNPYQK